MTEAQAAKKMKKTAGAVSAAVAKDPLSFFMALLSGNGPFSHVRGSDRNGRIVENNLSNGVADYWSPEYNDRKSNRLTYVTKNFVGGQNYGATVQSMKAANMSYFGAGMCVGATSRVNPYYTAGAPNNLYPWSLRNTYLYY